MSAILRSRPAVSGITFFGVLALALAAYFLLAPEKAWAFPEGTKGWCTSVVQGPEECGFPTPLAACQRQYESADPDVPFEGATPSGDKWHVWNCEWLHEFGEIPPSFVAFKCENHYVRVPIGRCVTENLPLVAVKACFANQGATPVGETGGPIDLLTGSKSFAVTDFETADGSLRLARSYASLPYGGSPDPSDNMVNRPIGLANWLFDFQIDCTSPSSRGPRAHVLFPCSRRMEAHTPFNATV
jgi:hypothetical protein